MPPPQMPNCVTVFIGSDSEGRFGFQCPHCQQYWRAEVYANVCPYCGLRGKRYLFLSNAQRQYVRGFCETFTQALHSQDADECIIDMDAVADATGKDIEKPPFYYAEEIQQKQFNCSACGQFNDVLGRFVYCSACGTRNDYRELESDIIPTIRADLNGGGIPSNCLKDTGSAFDTFVGQLTSQLIKNRPMRSRRREYIRKMRFHDLTVTRKELIGGFDIDICEGLTNQAFEKAVRMFQRRHVYEHHGGEVDQKYLDDSGDTSVRLKQMIRETQADVHEFANVVLRMAQNLHRAFHDIFEPIKEPIERFEAEKKRRAAVEQQRKPQGSVSPVQTAKHQLKGE
jgi:hypothetical protein